MFLVRNGVERVRSSRGPALVPAELEDLRLHRRRGHDHETAVVAELVDVPQRAREVRADRFMDGVIFSFFVPSSFLWDGKVFDI